MITFSFCARFRCCCTLCSFRKTTCERRARRDEKEERKSLVAAWRHRQCFDPKKKSRRERYFYGQEEKSIIFVCEALGDEPLPRFITQADYGSRNKGCGCYQSSTWWSETFFRPLIVHEFSRAMNISAGEMNLLFHTESVTGCMCVCVLKANQLHLASCFSIKEREPNQHCHTTDTRLYWFSNTRLGV